MKRKRLTQVFPFLLPIRKWQRKKLFYLEMLIDGNKYAKNKSEALLPKEKNLSRLIEYAVKLGVRDEVMMYVEIMV